MDVKDLPASIVDLELFAGLEAPQIALFLQRCRKLVMSGGQALMKAGELADCCYVIIRGKVDVRIRSHSQSTTLATLEAGQLVGEMGLFRDKPYRMADVVTVKDSLVVLISYDYLHRLEGLHHEIAVKIKANLQQIAQVRLQSLSKRGSEAGQPDMPGKPQADPPLLVPIQIKMALTRTPLFEGFDHDDLDRILERVTPLRFGPGEPIVLAGDAADCLFVIALGRLAVVIEADGEAHPIAQLGPGQCFGEIAFAHGNHVRGASVLADTVSTVLRLGYDDLDLATSWRPQTRDRFRINLERLVSERE